MMLNASSISCERKQLCNSIRLDLAKFSTIKLAKKNISKLPTTKHSTNKPLTKQTNIKSLEKQITNIMHSTHACEMNKKQ